VAGEVSSGIDFSETGVDFLEFPARYYYEFKSSNGLSVVVLRDEAPPKITDGRGGWSVVERRRRKGLTTWGGRNPFRMDVPILFNGQFEPPYSVDQDISVLNMMALGDNFVVPPTVTVNGYLPVNGIKWVIEDLKWGDNAIWLQSQTGETIRVRQDCIVQLLQYVEEDVVKITNTSPTPAPNSYTTKAGDTPKSIAKARYGDANMWKKIRDLNPSKVRDPNQQLPTNTVLQMPPKP
jgi:LysM repeat protein